MTSLSENDHKNEISIDTKQCFVETKHELLENNDSTLPTKVKQNPSDTVRKQEKLNENEISNELISKIQETNVINGIDSSEISMNTASPPIVTSDEEQKQRPKEATETTVNHDENEHPPKRYHHSKARYSSMSYHRSPYYFNSHGYGPAPFYYYPPFPPSLIEKPTPLMVIPTQLSPLSSPQISSSTSPSSRDNQSGNSTAVSPQNLPPRLRQTSITENESSLQVPSTTSQSTTPKSSTATTNANTTTATTTTTTTTTSSSSTTTTGRRHRSILSRSNSHYYHPSQLPPPLMATPPGVLYTYPPTVHQPGHVAYNIRPPDEFEILALQQHMMNMPPTPLLWPHPHTPMSPHGHPYFSPYPMGEASSGYILNNSVMDQPANSFLNPEAAEWVPLQKDNESSSDNNVLIHDEINFPPLNSTSTNTQTIANATEHTQENSEQKDTCSEKSATNTTDSTNDTPQLSTQDLNALPSQSDSKVESINATSSSQDDNNKPLSSASSPSPTKATPMTYSTIISQTSENNKSSKTNTNHQQPQRRQPQQQSKNHTPNQLPPKDRTGKQQQRTQMNSSNTNSNRRQPLHYNRNNKKNFSTVESNSFPKQQQQQQQQQEINDDWIEVKSKKTKKFDRISNDNSPEKLTSDEQVQQSLSPSLSSTSAGDNTTTTFTSEDDYDEKDNHNIVTVTDNHVPKDFNQTIVDDIHRRLDNHEKLLIIMRGCPGSGKSTLAKSINHGYNGVILSADDYFLNNDSKQYTFDSSKLDEAHRYNGRRASDAVKHNVSPVIIDNTNTQVWEMKPYVAMGKEAGYEILLVEPQTPWRYKARELFKRNAHNLPLKRIRDMLNRFEHNITVQSIINQLPSTKKTNNSTPTAQKSSNQNNELNDSMSSSKKLYNIVDDSLILDDVRLCMNDMILFLTSNFYQTTLLSSTSILTSTTTTTPTTTSQSSTSLSVSFHDLSLISSLPSSMTTTSTSLPTTSSTSHTRFHRPFARFPSTPSQDHSFNTDFIARMPSSTFSRCIDANNLTSKLTPHSNILNKKRRKNKVKQDSNEILLNVNNNNNNNNNKVNTVQTTPQEKQSTFNVVLAEDCPDFVIIDESDHNDWPNDANQNIEIKVNPLKDHSSSKGSTLTNPSNCELVNIVDCESSESSFDLSKSVKDISIQCSSNDFNSELNHSDRIFIGHLSDCSDRFILVPLSPLSKFNECGIQVDFSSDNNIDFLIKIYSKYVSEETIRQFFEICHCDLQLTEAKINEYLEKNHKKTSLFSTLKQLSLNVLNKWNEQIKTTSSLLDKNTIDNLFQSIYGNEIFEELTLDNKNIDLTDSMQTNIQSSFINSSKDSFEELSNTSLYLINNNDKSSANDLSIYIHQALQKLLIKSNSRIRPVIDNLLENQSKTKTGLTQQSILLSENQRNMNVNTNYVSSFAKVIHEEQQTERAQKLKQKCLQLKDIYKKALQANHYGMSAVALFYMHYAVKEAQSMKNVNQVPCELVLEWKLEEYHKTNQLDLHDLHLDEAVKLFQQIEQEFSEKNQRTTRKSIEIITDHEKIHSVILSYLQKQNYEYSELNNGVILLQLTNVRN